MKTPNPPIDRKDYCLGWWAGIEAYKEQEKRNSKGKSTAVKAFAILKGGFGMKLVITFILISLIVIVYVQTTIIRRVKLVEEHTELVGQTMKDFGYALDVITELQKAMKPQ